MDNGYNIEFNAARSAVRKSDPEKTEGLHLRVSRGGGADHYEVEARKGQFLYRWSVYVSEVRDAHQRVLGLQWRVVDRGYDLVPPAAQ